MDDDSQEEGGTGLFGLYHVEKLTQKLDLYDILFWAPNAKCFNSVFGVRSVNYWPGPTDSSSDDSIFATFDCRFTLPAGHFGGPPPESPELALSRPHKLAQLLPHERDLLGSVRRVPVRTKGDDPAQDPDPDTGVWVGEPG